jgi:D-glycero-D-manno-heptose 1,7-bisphosphate phosphatase
VPERIRNKTINKAVFLDRDGTIIKDCHYLKDPELVELLPHAGENLRRLKEHCFLLVMVSNQSGIARGFFSVPELQAVEKRLIDLLKEHGIILDGIYNCLHGPEDNCKCRKPAIGMALQAADELHINLNESYMVGDKESDIQFGKNFGAKASFHDLDNLISYLG